MSLIEPTKPTPPETSHSRGERELERRLALRMTEHWLEQRRLTEKLTAIESSTAWAVARRLSQWRQGLAPEGSRRHWILRLFVRGLRLWKREGIAAVFHRGFLKLSAQHRNRLDSPPLQPSPTRGEGERRLPPPLWGRVGVGGERFRIAFIGSAAACEAQSMRYRAHSIIEALSLAGIEGSFTTLEEVPAKRDAILAHDLIVLVRMMNNKIAAELIEAARGLSLPIVYDIDDYLFEPWILPYVEAFRAANPRDALRVVDAFGTCLHQCDYFTGSTSYLVERAAALGKESFVIHNGLNAAQLDLSRQAREQRGAHPRDSFTRLGYFSGTRTHQADFRLVYTALMSLLRQQPQVRLLIVGDLDLGEFPGLAPFFAQIEFWPLRPWTELPSAMAQVDVNLIPLELTPFNEGKSNLKYYEAGLVNVPSIASPTRIHQQAITHGHNGLLAQSAEEWLICLQDLVNNPQRREQMGQQAFEHVLQHYTPEATAREAVAVYRQILRRHLSQREAA